MTRQTGGTRAQGRDSSRGAERAQTTIDFAIGASIFLLVVAFVFAFTPGALTPFTEVEQPQSADRAASNLVGGALGSPDSPYLLDTTCTVQFFDHFGNDADVTADCRFDDEADSINKALGLAAVHNVNVSIRYDESVQTLENDDGETILLAAGDDRTAQTPKTTASRSVQLAGTVHRLVVHVW
jgi:hypothetical protein